MLDYHRGVHLFQDGNLVWTNKYGSKFMGEWKEGKRSGQGVLIISDGSMEGSTTFIGSFAEGRSVGTSQLRSNRDSIARTVVVAKLLSRTLALPPDSP
jgi:hypothetical protein